MSICPAGTIIGRFYGGALLCVVIDFFLVALFLVKRFHRDPARFKANLHEKPRALVSAKGGVDPTRKWGLGCAEGKECGELPCMGLGIKPTFPLGGLYLGRGG